MYKKIVAIILFMALALAPISAFADVTTDKVKVNNTKQSYLKKDFKLTLTFTSELLDSSVNTDTIALRNPALGNDSSADADIIIDFGTTNAEVVITLKENLDQNSTYKLIIDGVKDKAGNNIFDTEKVIEIRTAQEKDDFNGTLKPVKELKGTMVSPTSIKWTWKYDAVDEKYVTGFNIYDEEGGLLTGDNEVNAKDREYIQEGLTPGNTYSIAIEAYNDTESDEVIQSERTEAKVKLDKLTVQNVKTFYAKAQSTNIQYYWEYNSYKDYVDNFGDYVLQISKDKTFTPKNTTTIALIKGQYTEKKAVPTVSKAGTKVTRYYRVVNKALNKSSSVLTKVITIAPPQVIIAPQATLGDIDGDVATLRIKDLSKNEVSFNIYYLDKNGKSVLLDTISSNTAAQTGKIYTAEIVGFDPDEFYGFVVTAADKNGNESKPSQLVKIIIDNTDSDDSETDSSN